MWSKQGQEGVKGTVLEKGESVSVPGDKIRGRRGKSQEGGGPL